MYLHAPTHPGDSRSGVGGRGSTRKADAYWQRAWQGGVGGVGGGSPAPLLIDGTSAAAHASLAPRAHGVLGVHQKIKS
jgi:hypothetical protein